MRRKKKQPDIKIGSPEFIDLQKVWYSKLADEGFDDIEWTNPETGKTTTNAYLKRNTFMLAKQYDADKDEYYRLLQNYVTNASKKELSGRRLFIANHILLGTSYANIRKNWNTVKRRRKLQLDEIVLIVEELSQRLLVWNRIHKDGVYYVDETHDDYYIGKKWNNE